VVRRVCDLETSRIKSHGPRWAAAQPKKKYIEVFKGAKDEEQEGKEKLEWYNKFEKGKQLHSYEYGGKQNKKCTSPTRSLRL
jgi:hypothetical protein